ncbi:MAG: hypothetical protein JW891_11655 [Candidatus Lokiarchaeota archaeon]|nr:hypothetical protein [Candidatus Lokiarchaeota archaeon]
MAESEQVNVKDWITLSSVMIGAVLTILALIWQVPPVGDKAIVVATYLLMISFIFFVNSVSCNSKANYEARTGKASGKVVDRFVAFAEYSFGIGFTFIICGFSILGYGYLMGYTTSSNQLLALIFPITFIVVTLFIMMVYNTLNSGSPIGSLKRSIWSIVEIACVVLIAMDYFGAIVIP